MRSLDLNLASRPFRNNTPLWIGFALAVAGTVAFAAWSTSTFLGQRERVAELDGRLDGADETMREYADREAAARARIAALDVKNLAIQAARANGFLMRRGLSWTRLFNLLETVQPPEVKMTAVRPVFGRERGGAAATELAPEGVVPISVEGIAQDLDAFLEFERQLLQDPHFARVEPQRADRVRNSREILFDLRFLYDPDGRLGGGEGVRLPPVLPAQAEAEESAAEEARR
jgi:hypothetical protein